MLSWSLSLVLLLAVGGEGNADLDACLCFDSASDSKCPGSSDACKDYAISIVKEVAVPAGVLFVLLVLLGVFALVRRCCHCCGDARPRSGCCCAKETKFTGYGRTEVFLFKFLMVFSLVAAVAVGIPSMTLNEEVTTGVTQIGGALDANVDAVLYSLDVIVSEVAKLHYADISGAQRNDVVEAAAEARSQIESITDYKQDKLYHYDHTGDYSRKRLVTVCIALIFGCFASVACLALFNVSGCLSGLVFGLIFLFSLFLIVITAVHHAASLTTDHVCESYGGLTGSFLEKMESKLGCSSNSSDGLSQIVTRVEDAKHNFKSRMCTSMTDTVCRPSSHFVCNMSACTGQSTLSDVALILNTSRASPALMSQPEAAQCSDPCSPNMCMDECEDGALKDSISSLSGNFTLYNEVFRRIEAEVYPVATCFTLRMLRDQLEAPLCDKISTSFNELFVIFLTLNGLLLVAGLLVVLGTKRFTSHVRRTNATHPTETLGKY